MSKAHGDPRSALCTAVLPVWGRLLATAQAQSETAVAEMLSAFGELAPLLEGNTSTDLQTLVERMYIGFQYQDRISQMLSLLHADMTRLESTLQDATSSKELAANAWLERLESQYAMAEQHAVHSKTGGDGAAPAAGDETTFF
jgi:methyl-accepting chemotaxis protein